jgi:monofunctional biosynthetic peptidoglycan transglycosylase
MFKTLGRWLWKSLVLLLIIVLFYQLWVFLHVCWWIDHNPSTSAFMDERLAIIQEKNPDAELRHKWVPYDRISNNLKRALIAASRRLTRKT